MTFRLLYLLFCQVLRWLALLVLRHQVAVLRRQVARSRVIAAAPTRQADPRRPSPYG